MLAELLDERIDLGMHHYLILIPDAVLSQEVKLDMVTRHALHILNLHITTKQALTSRATEGTSWHPCAGFLTMLGIMVTARSVF